MNNLTVVQLKDKARSLNLKGYSKLNKDALINLLSKNQISSKSPKQYSEEKSCPITGEGHCHCKFTIKPIEPPTAKDTFRKLFTDHANYTYLYILSEVNQLPNLKVITERLLQNQVDIGDAMKPIVGEETGNAVTKLLKEHILAASNATKKAIANNRDNTKKSKDNLDEAIKKVFENSEEVSRGLSNINPQILPFKEVHKHFNEHNTMVLELVVLNIQGNFKKAITEYDCYYTHILGFSDMLSQIAK
jgi:hypothetical protein